MARGAPQPASDRLEAYRARRDFAATPEPDGRAPPAGDERRFVVQRHAARRLHHDLRLSIGGVMASWAVTRGPSDDPADKRLAVRTEDHPLDYDGFEGVIPPGHYGAGTMMIWDRGSWEPVDGKDPEAMLADGHLHMRVQGQRMRGAWILVRLRPKPGERRENWILRAVGAAPAGQGALVERFATSVATGRTLDEIAAGAPPRAAAMPGFRSVQLATLVPRPPRGGHWLHEIKHDGWRCLAALAGGEARAWTRSGRGFPQAVAALAPEAARLAGRSLLVDGEAVVLDDEGRSSFAALGRLLADGTGRLVVMAFDLLELDGEDWTPRPLVERKARLGELLAGAGPTLVFGQHLEGEGEAVLAEACRLGLEGIVSKDARAPYRAGRGRAWLKAKCVGRGRFAVVGWTERAGALRSLLLAERVDDGLRYVGRVGTGFGREESARLAARLQPLELAAPALPIPAAGRRGARFARPELDGEVAFAERTADGLLRHASWAGLVTPARHRPQRPLSHAARVIFPETGETKADLAAYMAAMAGPVLEHLGGRLMSLVRCPEGRQKSCFFQRHAPAGLGEAVRRVAVGGRAYLAVDDAEGLHAAVQMGAIEFHGWASRADRPDAPDRLVFDLDPDEGLGFAEVARAARDVRAALAELGLESFLMATGGKGLHVVAPLEPVAEWERFEDFAGRFARALALAEPGRFTASLSKKARAGRIFLDHLRNRRGATAVMPWTVRARAGAPVATPLTWEELDGFTPARAWRMGQLEELQARAARLAGWGRARQRLPEV